MKTKDIIVGQKYTHINYPGVIYLGIGMQTVTSKVFAKHLVVLDSGMQVIPPRRQSSGGYMFWAGFRKVEEP